MWLLLALQLWISTRNPANPAIILAGFWQSCRDDNGDYVERAFDYVVNGRQVLSFHLGPADDFALFRGREPDPDDHSSPKNLLTAHRVSDLPTLNDRRAWRIPALSVAISVVRAGGSREECMSWDVLIERTK